MKSMATSVDCTRLCSSRPCVIGRTRPALSLWNENLNITRTTLCSPYVAVGEYSNTRPLTTLVPAPAPVPASPHSVVHWSGLVWSGYHYCYQVYAPFKWATIQYYYFQIYFNSPLSFLPSYTNSAPPNLFDELLA